MRELRRVVEPELRPACLSHPSAPLGHDVSMRQAPIRSIDF
jgi:hypothetical protein